MPREAGAQHTPQVALVSCEDTRDWSPLDAQADAHALVGLAGLVGVPYDTLMLSELLAMESPAYTSVWFACPVLSDANHDALGVFLTDHVGAGGEVFLQGPLGLYMPDESEPLGVSFRGMDAFRDTLKVIDGGWFPLAGYQVFTGDSDHVVAQRMDIPPLTQVSQPLIDGIETMDLASVLDPDGAFLLEVAAPDDMLRYPLLVATETESGARVVAIGAYSNYVGPGSSFHNETPVDGDEPAGFYDNQVLPYLVEALVWLEKPADAPMVGLQLSHAPMTAIGRLDGDWSDDTPATEETFLYLLDLARTTGLATVYGIVSDFAERTGNWEAFRLGGMQLEALGGAIGSHSHTHNDMMSATLSASEWITEVQDSLDMIRAELSGSGFSPEVKALINPGETIDASDYPLFFNDVELYMTHGFESSVPYASGVMDFDLPADVTPTVVLNNVPNPDFQWLYEEGWVYQVPQAADYQAQILDYYQRTVGRGVLYNQMWHDYAIGGELAPVHFPTQSPRELFDVNRAHFETNQVYMPSVRELVAKYHIASKARHTTSADGNTVSVTIDYQAVPTKYRGFVSGMGLRINGAGAIASVSVDGAPHFAFSRHTVLLPQPGETTQEVVVSTGGAPEHPRLSFSSKPIGEVTLEGDVLTFGWADDDVFRKGCVTGPPPLVLLDADSLRRAGNAVVCGMAEPGSSPRVSTAVVDAGDDGFFLDGATRPILSAGIEGQIVTLVVAADDRGEKGTLDIRTGGPPIRVRVNDKGKNVSYEEGGFELEIPPGESTVTIELMQCTDSDGDGASTCAGDCNDSNPDVGVCERGGGCGCQSGPGSGGLVWFVLVALLSWRRLRDFGARVLRE